MKRFLWIVIFFIFLSPISLFASETSNPASIDYVDKVFADLQKQLDALEGNQQF